MRDQETLAYNLMKAALRAVSEEFLKSEYTSGVMVDVLTTVTPWLHEMITAEVASFELMKMNMATRSY